MKSDKTPRLSLCMIARDEEATIGRALAAARSFCDEMIVVDTGSTDSTADIARNAGARVVSQPWTDDFATARNRSLDEATGDFALVLDADEFLNATCGRGIREALRRPDTYGVFVPILNRFEDGREIAALILRVFPLRPDLRYRYRIHEQVIDTLVGIAKRERGRLIQVGGEVLHEGYRKDVIQARGKNVRNRRIFELALADDPSDLYLRYKFADFLRATDPGPRVREILESVARDLRELDSAAVHDLPFAGEVFALLAQECRDAGDPGQGLQWAEEGLRVATATVNLTFIHGSLACDLGDATTAARAFRECLAQDGQALVMPGQSGTTGILAEVGLARALHDLQRFDEARGVLEHAADRHPGREDLVTFWLACARHTRNPAAALQWVAKRLQRNPADHQAWFAGGQLLYGVGLFEQARTWFGRAAGGLAEPAPALAFYAECFLHEADLEGALEIASQAPAEPRAQAVIAAVSLAAETEVPSLVRSSDPDVRSAFRTLLANLRRTPGRPIVDKIESVCASMSVFDPAGMALAASALAVSR